MNVMVVLEHDQNFLTTGIDATSKIDWMENSDILQSYSRNKRLNPKENRLPTYLRIVVPHPQNLGRAHIFPPDLLLTYNQIIYILQYNNVFEKR